MAGVRSPFPLACSSSCWSSAPGNTPTSSPAASLSGELSVAMSVVPIHYRPSGMFITAAGAGKQGVEGGLRRRSQLGRWSTAIERLSGQQEGNRTRRSQERGSIYANYGIKDYGTPLPPYDAPPQVKQSLNVKPSSGGRGGEVRKFWDYGSPKSLRDYSSPKSYGAPKDYGIPAYSARVAAVEAIEPPQGLELEVINAEPREQEPELGGGDGGQGKEGGRGGGGGGGDGSGEGEESEPQKPMSMSQKLTLAYAALVGVGGVIGFAKSGSNKSLMAGGGAALALFLVYAQLPAHPTFASFFGLGISAALLGIMYPRFKQSGKFMPSGLVALVSLIMTGGYVHGIVRTAH